MKLPPVNLSSASFSSTFHWRNLLHVFASLCLQAQKNQPQLAGFPLPQLRYRPRSNGAFPSPALQSSHFTRAHFTCLFKLQVTSEPGLVQHRIVWRLVARLC